jgi:phage host-nuclease inhibitor protein Gam
VDQTPVLSTWEQADEALRQIGLRRIALDELEADLQGRVDRLKGVYGEKVAPLVQEVKAFEKQLEEFAAAHRSDLGKAKSKRLVFGSLGFRVSTALKLIVGHTWETVLDLVKARPASWQKRLLRTKEEVDRAALWAAKSPKEVLACLGLELERLETFGYDLDLEKVREGVEARLDA